MTRTSLKWLALLAACFAFLGSLHAFYQDLSEGQPVFELDFDHARQTWSDPTPDVLHLALVRMARGANTEAMIEAVQIPLYVGREFHVELGFLTLPVASDPEQYDLREIRSGDQHWRREVRNSRPLPPEFMGLKLELKLTGTYYGSHEGTHLLTIAGLDLRIQVSGSLGGNGFMSDHVALQRDTPITRVIPDDGLAFFAMLTSEGSRVVDGLGMREDWRQAFLLSAYRNQGLDRATIVAAVEALNPTVKETRANEDVSFRSYGPLVNLLSAGFVLRDTEAVQFARKSLGDDDELLEKMQATGYALDPQEPARERYNPDAVDWLEFVSHWMTGSTAGLSKTYGVDRVHMGLLELTEDEAVAAYAVDRLLPYVCTSAYRDYILKTTTLGQTDATRAQYSRMRSAVVSRMPAPWNVAFRSFGWLVAYSLFVPLLALAVILVRPKRAATPFVFGQPMLLLLIVTFMITLGDGPAVFYFLPILWFQALRWMRHSIRHSFPERCLIWLALTLHTVRACQSVGFYFKTPGLDFAAAWGPYFYWILIGLWILEDDRWRRVGRFNTAMKLILAYGIVVTLFHPTEYNPVDTVIANVGLIFLAAFWIGGLNPTPPDPQPQALVA